MLLLLHISCRSNIIQHQETRDEFVIEFSEKKLTPDDQSSNTYIKRIVKTDLNSTIVRTELHSIHPESLLKVLSTDSFVINNSKVEVSKIVDGTEYCVFSRYNNDSIFYPQNNSMFSVIQYRGSSEEYETIPFKNVIHCSFFCNDSVYINCLNLSKSSSLMPLGNCDTSLFSPVLGIFYNPNWKITFIKGDKQILSAFLKEMKY